MCPRYNFIKDRKFYNRNLSSGKHPTKPLSINMLEYSAPAVLINTHATSPEQQVTTLPRMRSQGRSHQMQLIVKDHELHPSFKTRGTRTTSQRARYFNKD